MVDPELLKILCCPETHQPLQPADPERLERLNQEILAGLVQTCRGKAVQAPLEAGLVREDGRVLFPVRHNIPVMLMEEAIPLAPD